MYFLFYKNDLKIIKYLYYIIMKEYKKDSELYTNKNYYSIEHLKDNIKDYTLWAILHTQTLTPDFCVEYLLVPDNKYAKDEEDEDIYINNILYWQRHITKDDLLNCEFMQKYKENNEKNINFN